VALAAVALYARTIGFGWVYDDRLDVVRNTFVQSFAYLPQWFTSTAWAGAAGENFLYRPLALLTYALNYQVSALEPWSYHLVNIVLHAGVSVLVVRVGRMWGLSTMAAGLGGLLFAVHPVHVEVAAAVFGRKDALAALFTLAMVLLHRRAMARGGWTAALPVVAYACAMLSKEAGVVGLALVAVHDWFLEADRGRLLRNQRAAGLYVAYLLTFLVYLLVRTTVVGGIGVADTSFLDNPMVAAGPGARLGTAIVVVGRGVALLAAPLKLSPDYSYDAIPVVQSLFDLRLAATLVALGLLGWVLATGRVRGPVVPLGVLWYAIALFPTSSLLLPVGTIFAERLLYLPSVAACLLTAAGLAWVSRRSRRVALAAAFALVAGLTVQTVRYSSVWREDIPLFRWAVANVPRSTKAHHILGEELLWAGYLGEGVRELDLALAIAPGNKYAASTWAVAERFIADRYAQGGEDAVDPPTDPDVLSVLAKLSGDRGDFAQAERYWQAALSLDPLHSHSLAGMGLMHLIRSDTASAIGYLELAVAQELPPANAWFNLGRIHLARGENWPAARALRQFVALAGSRYPSQVQWAEGALATLTQ
jgi:tetratricopeptide (TPR) repeat protein